jgi:hypothetical protein
MNTRLTEAEVQNCSWELVETTPDFRRYVGRGTHPVTGTPIMVQKTEYIAESALLHKAAAERADSMNRRWSYDSGSEKGGNVPMVKVGSIPLNKFYAEVAPRLQHGDKDFMRWFWNHEDNAAFRSREGKV